VTEQRAPMTMIICYGRRRCEVVRVEHCPDCRGVVDLDAKEAHQCSLFELGGSRA
jgi:hypothetical protein